MNSQKLAAVIESCERLRSEGRSSHALDLLQSVKGAYERHEPAWWTHTAAILLDLGRVQEAEKLLREGLRKPAWPFGNASIASWLARSLMWMDRWSDAEMEAKPWAERGNLDCQVIVWRAMLNLGRPREVRREAAILADGGAMNHVGIQLVYLEATLDSSGSAPDGDAMAEARRIHSRLRNMQRNNVLFDADQQDWMERLSRRMDGPFGFARR
jgi:hypothetical protein